MNIIDVNVDLNYQSLPLGDPTQSNGSTKKMTKLFEIELDKFTKLDKGLENTVHFFLKEG